MALQVWLPGTSGTLLNQGLYKLPNSSYNSISEFTLGKLGKAIKGNAMYHLSSDIFGNKWSVACWIKFISGYSQYNNIILCLNTSDSEDSKFYLSIVNNTYLNIGRGSSSGVTYTLSGGFIIDTWYHVAATCDDTKTYLYLNGNLVNSGNVGSAKSALNLGIGCRSTNNAGTNITGFSWPMNDVRIYDHCLSHKEVKEISKGLVLHYKLSDGYVEATTNYIPFENDFDSWSSYGFGSKGTKSVASGSTPNGVGRYCIVGSTATSIANVEMARSFSAPSLAQNEKATFSCYVRGVGNTVGRGGYIHIYNSNGTNVQSSTVQTFIFTAEWQRVSGQFTWNYATAAGTTYNCYVVGTEKSGETFEFCEPQFEIKDHATPYTPSSRNSTTVYDCSGLDNNGTIDGTPTLVSETPKYDKSTYFQKGSGIYAYLNIAFSAFTIAFWGKHTEANKMLMGSNTPSSKNTIWYWYGDNSFKYYSGEYYYQHNAGSSFLNEWMHFVVTYDGSKVSVYRNAVFEGSKDATGNMPMEYLSVGNGYYNSAYWENGTISDFRMYSTALSDDDIRELYNTSAYIYNNGTMSSYEFVEESTSPQITKSGLSKSTNFSEYSTDLKVLSDGSVWVRLLHHNQPSTYLFTQNNCWNNKDANLFSALGLLKNDTWANSSGEYEFMICEKTTSGATEGVYRWKQTSNPATTSTVTGYSVISGSPAHPLSLRNNGAHGCFHNGSTWWVCCGSWQQEGGGVPGVAGYVTTGYIDFYVRVPELKMLNEANAMFHKNNIQTNQLIEI